MKQFDFGQNWKNYSNLALNKSSAKQAEEEFNDLFDGIPLDEKFFLDVGFGQGLSLLCALRQGANVVGCDINEKCEEALDINLKFFPECKNRKKHIIIGSILETSICQKIANLSKPSGKYDVVHSWGVLHHTGNMYKAIDTCADLVVKNGHFVIAIYNKHWSSLPWKWIKFIYVSSPRVIKQMMIVIFYAVIYVAKLCVTMSNPLKKRRGMNFYYDVVDWVGGYPYEYASRKTVVNYVESKGFKLIRFVKANTPIGCNQFVFERISEEN